MTHPRHSEAPPSLKESGASMRAFVHGVGQPPSQSGSSVAAGSLFDPCDQ